MSRHSEHTDNNTSDGNHWLDQFSEDEKDRIRELWRLSAGADRKEVEMEEHEIEEALAAVRLRIGKPGKNPGMTTSVFNTQRWRWVAAAAVLLLIFASGIFLIPQTVEAPRGQISKVTLPDGSTVELNSGSRIWYNRLFALTHRTVRLDGEAFFSVRHGEPPFEVEANGTIVKVTGTKFNVRSWSDEPRSETEVTVTEGRVNFYAVANTEARVTLGPGQLSRMGMAMNKPTSPVQVAENRIAVWRERQLIFNNESLAVIFRELERRFDIRIEFEERIKDEKLTTYYAKPGKVETIIQDICRVKGLHYSVTAGGYRIYR